MLEDRRCFFRFPATVPLRYQDNDGGVQGWGETHDISAKGIGFFTDREMPPDTSLDICLQVPDREDGICVKGSIVWSRLVAPQRYRVGVSLEKVDFISMSHVLRLA
ncbi:MAG TPA: PilZ domain-containing protein [Patescibacteria group bacterium]|nr:PilZ domain-containing protein [Patescibacteria group bacterium]